MAVTKISRSPVAAAVAVSGTSVSTIAPFRTYVASADKFALRLAAPSAFVVSATYIISKTRETSASIGRGLLLPEVKQSSTTTTRGPLLAASQCGRLLHRWRSRAHRQRDEDSLLLFIVVDNDTRIDFCAPDALTLPHPRPTSTCTLLLNVRVRSHHIRRTKFQVASFLRAVNTSSKSHVLLPLVNPPSLIFLFVSRDQNKGVPSRGRGRE